MWHADNGAKTQPADQPRTEEEFAPLCIDGQAVIATDAILQPRARPLHLHHLYPDMCCQLEFRTPMRAIESYIALIRLIQILPHAHLHLDFDNTSQSVVRDVCDSKPYPLTARNSIDEIEKSASFNNDICKWFDMRDYRLIAIRHVRVVDCRVLA